MGCAGKGGRIGSEAVGGSGAHQKRRQDMAAKEVYWHLPGFCYFRLLNQVIMNMMKDYPDRFREGYRIGSVYGTA